MSVHLPEIYTVAIKAAIEASVAILKVYKQDFKAMTKKDGSAVTEADLLSSEIIAKALETTNIPILGEELEKDAFSIRQHWTENWCVDPLDGTKMFVRKNDEFCVNIAHVVGGNPAFGIIAAPVEQTLLVGGPLIGSYHFQFDQLSKPEEWKRLTSSPQSGQEVRIVGSRSYREECGRDHVSRYIKSYQTVEYLYRASALKFFNLALNEAQIYPRFAPTMEWDIAAGQAILEALGGRVIDVQTGTPLTYNKESLYNPHFIAITEATWYFAED